MAKQQHTHIYHIGDNLLYGNTQVIVKRLFVPDADGNNRYEVQSCTDKRNVFMVKEFELRVN